MDKNSYVAWCQLANKVWTDLIINEGNKSTCRKCGADIVKEAIKAKSKDFDRAVWLHKCSKDLIKELTGRLITETKPYVFELIKGE
jgi:hypothetical protein